MHVKSGMHYCKKCNGAYFAHHLCWTIWYATSVLARPCTELLGTGYYFNSVVRAEPFKISTYMTDIIDWWTDRVHSCIWTTWGWRTWMNPWLKEWANYRKWLFCLEQSGGFMFLKKHSKPLMAVPMQSYLTLYFIYLFIYCEIQLLTAPLRHTVQY